MNENDEHSDESVVEHTANIAGAATPASRSSSQGNPRRTKSAKFAIALAIVLGVLVIGGAVSALISVPYYAITPGSGINVATLIHLPKGAARSHHGEVLLTDVELEPLRALTYLYFKFDHNADIVSSQTLVGSASSAQYDEQGVIDMDNARLAATVAGLNALGYRVSAIPSGAAVYGTFPGSPAAKGLAVGDVITAVNGKATLSATTLAARLENTAPGDRISVTSHVIGTSSAHRIMLQLGAEYTSGTGANAVLSCLSIGTKSSLTVVRRAGKPVACLGVELEQEYAPVHLPFPVTIDADGIIGPSAGLAFTLGLIQQLDGSDLMAGHRIAATGTMSIAGAVGDVGGVAQKTVAVRDAGATIFLVPPEEKAVALKNAGPHLKIVAVSTLGQAISELEHLGGKISSPASRS